MKNNNIVIEPVKDFNTRLISQIEELEIEAFGKEAASNHWLIPVIIRYGRAIIARITDGRLLGVCLSIKSWNNGQTAYIHSFHLRDGYRRRGIGTSLLYETIHIYKNENINTVELTVNPENKGAICFYQKHNFKVDGIRRNEYGTGKDRYLMRLKL